MASSAVTVDQLRAVPTAAGEDLRRDSSSARTLRPNPSGVCRNTARSMIVSSSRLPLSAASRWAVVAAAR